MFSFLLWSIPYAHKMIAVGYKRNRKLFAFALGLSAGYYIVKPVFEFIFDRRSAFLPPKLGNSIAEIRTHVQCCKLVYIRIGKLFGVAL